MTVQNEPNQDLDSKHCLVEKHVTMSGDLSKMI